MGAEMDNTTSAMTRRAAVSALAAFALAPRLAAAAPAALRFRQIRVDVSPLADKDEADWGRVIERVLPAELQRSFGAYLAPGDRNGATLVARIDLVTLGAPGQGSLLFESNFSTTDSINGVGIVLDGRGRPVATYPLFSSMHADTQPNSPYQEDVLRRRVETLALSFAQWLPGQMGL